MENKTRKRSVLRQSFKFTFMLEIEGNIRKSGKKIRKYQEIFIIEKGNLDFGYGSTVNRIQSNNHFASFYSAILNISIVGENSVYAHA